MSTPAPLAAAMHRFSIGDTLSAQNQLDREPSDREESLRWKRAMEHAQQESLSLLFKPMPPLAVPNSTALGTQSRLVPASLHIQGLGSTDLPISKVVTLFSGQITVGSLIEDPSTPLNMQSEAGQFESPSVEHEIHMEPSGNNEEGDSFSSLESNPAFSSVSVFSKHPLPPKELALAAAFGNMTSESGTPVVLVVEGPDQTLKGGGSPPTTLEPQGLVFLSGAPPATPILPVAMPYQISAPSSLPLQMAAPPLSIVQGGKLVEPTLPAPARASRTTLASESMESSVRLYAEWSAEGVRIWVGANAGQPLQLQHLAMQMRQWLSMQGERLVALICNGHTVWRESDLTDAVLGSEDEVTEPHFHKNGSIRTIHTIIDSTETP